MEMQQIIEMLAEMKADRKANQEDLLARMEPEIDAIGARTEATQDEMLADMGARMDANTKEMNAKMDTRKAKVTKQEEMPAEISARMNANLKDLKKKKDIKSSQTEMRSTVCAILSELETIQHEMKGVMSYVDQKTQNLCRELTETIEKSQAELQTVEVSLDAQARRLQEDLAKIRSEHLRDYDFTHVTLQTTFNETRSALKQPNASFRLSWK
jgi:hypothetical protein